MTPPPPHNRYDVSGNVEAQFVDDSQSVLVNKLGITNLESLQLQEEAGLAQAYELLVTEVRSDTSMSCELIKYVHQRIFGNLFEWAGRWRTLQISKPGVIWPAAQYLDQTMQEFERSVLKRYPASTLLSDDEFCHAVGEIQGEFLAIHPFREGNARTIKLLTDLIAAQTGRPFLVYDQTEDGAIRYVAAASAALLKRDYQPMTEMVRDSLVRARFPRVTEAAKEFVDGSHPETGANPQ